MSLLVKYGLIPAVFDKTCYESDDLWGVYLQNIEEVLLQEGLVRDLQDGKWSHSFATALTPVPLPPDSGHRLVESVHGYCFRQGGHPSPPARVMTRLSQGRSGATPAVGVETWCQTASRPRRPNGGATRLSCAMRRRRHTSANGLTRGSCRQSSRSLPRKLSPKAVGAGLPGAMSGPSSLAAGGRLRPA